MTVTIMTALFENKGLVFFEELLKASFRYSSNKIKLHHLQELSFRLFRVFGCFRNQNRSVWISEICVRLRHFDEFSNRFFYNFEERSDDQLKYLWDL